MLLLVALVIIGGFFVKTWYQDPEARLVSTHILPEMKHIAEPIQIDISVELPWYRWLLSGQIVNAPEELQFIRDERKSIGLGWGTWIWRERLFIQATSFGHFTQLEANLILHPNRRGSGESFFVSLPDISIFPRRLDPRNPALLLGVAVELEEREDSKQWIWWVLLGGPLLFVAIVLLIYRSRSRSQVSTSLSFSIPIWKQTAKALQDLRAKLPIEAECFYVELSNIVREYIKQFYQVPVTAQSTEEFLGILRKGNVTFKEADKGILENLLCSADLVKFARADASVELMHEALTVAEHFIESSTSQIRSRIVQYEQEEQRMKGEI